jgi:hypothetical protein
MPKVLTEKDYFFDKEYITHSMIKDFLEKGEYYYYLKHIKKVKEPFFSKDYFDFGTAVDKFFDGGWALFDKMVHIVSKRTGNVPFGEVELTNSNGEKVKVCIGEMENQPLMRYFNHGQKQAILQVEDYRGCKLKGKLDNINVEEGFISDVKTTANIDTFEPLNYAMQLSMYGMMAEMIYGKPFKLVLLVVDKYEDYPRSEIYEFTDETRAMAIEKVNSALDLIKDRMEYNTWALPNSRSEIFKTALYKEMPNYEITETIKV